jgi:putative ABC transport system permease protein
MLKNYLKIALRALWNSKTHSVINILGLGVGIACCVLIALFVKDESTFDTFHSKAKDIYRVYVKEDWGENQQFINTVTPFPMGPTLKENFPEIENQVRFVKFSTQVKVGETLFNETISVGGIDFFKMFDFEVLKGNTENALLNQNSIAISDWVATKFFGTGDPINRIISIQVGEDFEEFTVTAVVNVPTNSSLQFYLLISDLNFPKLYSQQTLTSGWFNVNPETYVLLANGVLPSQLELKFPTLFKSVLGDEEFNRSHYQVGLQPMTKIHSDTTLPVGIAPVSDSKYTFIMAGIAALILIVACVNFVTLAIGRSVKRAKEVGIRKVSGAKRQEIMWQFIGEALLVTCMALLVGLTLAYFTLPVFNDLSGKSLQFPFNLFMVGVMMSLLFVIGLLSGSYPALVLSGFTPMSILKGVNAVGSNKQALRKVLVGFQLTLSVFLISCSLLMREQLLHLQNKNLGFDKEQLVVMQINVPRGGRLTERVAKGFEVVEQFKVELEKVPDVASVCGSAHDFGNGAWTDLGYTDDLSVYRNFRLNVVDANYAETLKLNIVQGRNFSDSVVSDKRRAIIINESLAREYGWSNPIGKKLPGKNFLDHEIIGVVKDFNYSSLYTKVDPLALVEDPSILLAGSENINIDNSPIPKLMVRLKPGDMGATIQEINNVWNKITGSEEFAFTFVDQALDAQYRNDQNLGRIIAIATYLAIFIGCSGLFALASLALQARIKEVSIRKVMGASEKSLLILLSKDFVWMVLISVALSIPGTILFVSNWLESFYYRIEIGWGIFVLAGLASLIISITTVSYHTIKTTMTQPAETLKHE